MTSLYILLLGTIGIAARYTADMYFQTSGGSRFPTTTLLINIVGCFLAAAIFVLGTEKGLFSPRATTALLVGFCGGFTTFSAYGLQSLLLLEKGQWVAGAAYLLGSPVVGLAATAAGYFLTKRFC